MPSTLDALQQFYVRENLPPVENPEGCFVWIEVDETISIPVPNTATRRAVLRHHDLHHMITGYGTDRVGECEMGAWGLATGSGPLTAMLFDTLTTAAGLVLFPKRTLAAWRRGRTCRNLYFEPIEDLMAMDVAVLRTLVGLDADAVT